MKRLTYSGRLFRQFWDFAREKKAYWIVPLVLVLAAVGLVIATSNVVTPLIYAIF